MAGFRKAKAEQAALKMGIFGPAGSGKTFTALLIAEGLAALDGRRVAYWDTEHGTDFYAKAVPNRRCHPEAFDFDATYHRSLTTGLGEVKALDPRTHGVVVIDSMTHLWEAAVAAYSGSRPGGKIPMQAWSGIKRPYKELMTWMINSPLHVIILGRQAYEWGQDDETGATVQAGVKFKAEGETGYEPHLLVRMEGVKPLRADGKTVQINAEAVPTMFVIKDRTGVLQGRVIELPNYKTVAAPIVGLLGGTQAQVQTEDAAAVIDAENLRKAEQEKAARSFELRKQFLARFDLVKGPAEADVIAKELTPELKQEMLPQHVADLRQRWKEVTGQVPPAARTGDGGEGRED